MGRDTLGDLDHQGQRPDQSANRDTYRNWASQIGVNAESSPDTDCMLDAVVAVRIFAPLGSAEEFVRETEICGANSNFKERPWRLLDASV